MYSCHLETPAPRGEHPYPAVPTHNAEIPGTGTRRRRSCTIRTTASQWTTMRSLEASKGRLSSFSARPSYAPTRARSALTSSSRQGFGPVASRQGFASKTRERARRHLRRQGRASEVLRSHQSLATWPVLRGRTPPLR